MNNKSAAVLKRHNVRASSDMRKETKGKSGVKRHSKIESSRNGKRAKKRHHRGEGKVFSAKIDDSEEFHEEDVSKDSDGGEAGEVSRTEPSSYDYLLKKLGSHNLSVANAFKRRQRQEEGKSDTDEESSDMESLTNSVEEDDGKDVSPWSQNRPKKSGDNRVAELMKNSGIDDDDHDDDDDGDGDDGDGGGGGDDGDDDDALSYTDEESDLQEKDQPLSEASAMMSTFDNHLNYKLSSTEVESLMSMKWSYTWKIPALNMPNCNWRGTEACSIKELDVHSYYDLKLGLYKHWLEIFEASGGSDFHQSKQKSFFSICNSYCDIMHHNKKPFYLKSRDEDASTMDAYLMHSLNHIFRSRDLMVKNERKLAKHQESMYGKILDGDAYLDRGFTRPKVLILLPLAGIARRVVKRFIHLTPSKYKANVENAERFYEEFGSGRSEDNDDEDNQEVSKLKKSAKPPDFQALLGDNNNDHFMIGVKFANRGIKLYGDFYTSDMIVASPLGLITKIGQAEDNKEKDVDYLSSIEILIIDHADVILMQNWSHVNTVAEHLNKLPSKQHGTDIMRIRPWYLDGQSQFYRQTIVLSFHINPELNGFFSKHCLNYHGKVKLECKYKGVLPKILIPVRQIYERFDTQSISEADDARLKFFCDKVFPKIKDSVQNGVMIFVSSYFEYVRLWNYLKSQAASCCLFGEYIKRDDISHVRGQFFRGEKKIMLYTERAHFYYRYKIRGVQNLIIYSLPERKEFYPEILNFLEESDNMNCTVLFSRLDHLRLERVVGSTAAKRMVESDKGVFVFA